MLILTHMLERLQVNAYTEPELFPLHKHSLAQVASFEKLAKRI